MNQFSVGVLSLVVAGLVSSIQAKDLRVGAAALKITPPLGIPMAGYYSARAAEGVHDDLYAKALVLEKDGNKAALVVLDVITTQRPWVEEARRQVEAATGIPAGQVMISATHSHTGPSLSANNLRELAFMKDPGPSQRYTASLPERIACAVQAANSNLGPVKVSAAVGREDSLAFNRRYFMKDGTVGWNPGKLNPNIVKPAGPIDPAVPVVYFEGLQKQPIATYVNYAVHLDNIGGLQISADVPGVVARLLAAYKGPEMVTLYATGTCGDINHIDVNWADRQNGHENPARMGTILAAEVFKTWPLLKAVTDNSLVCRSELVKLPLPPLSAGQIKKSIEVRKALQQNTTPKPKFLEQVDAFKVADVQAREGQPLEAEVQVITLGNELAWVSLPGEIFVELGLDIKKRSPFSQTMMAELANGSIGYVPTRHAYAEGNYEVVSARCAEGSGELLVEAAIKLLNEAADQGSKKR